MRFNAVNGKHCCNPDVKDDPELLGGRFNTVNGKHCCNALEKDSINPLYMPLAFQYRKR